MKSIITLLLLFLTPLAWAEDLSGHPGYADFGDLTGLSGVEPSVELSLGPALIRFVAAATRAEDSELADTLGKLQSINVSVFDIPPDRIDSISARADEISRVLERSQWEPAVKVRSTDGSINLYMKTEAGVVQGMVVMIVEPGEDAIFLNIVGQIDPEQLGRVASRFGVSIDDL